MQSHNLSYNFIIKNFKTSTNLHYLSINLVYIQPKQASFHKNDSIWVKQGKRGKGRAKFTWLGVVTKDQIASDPATNTADQVTENKTRLNVVYSTYPIKLNQATLKKT